MALPTPIGRQREVLALPAAGHTVVLGTAGSGKTTLAILRSAFLSRKSTPHGGPTLLLTFNKALVTYLKFLNSGEALEQVTVENYHVFARGYLKSRGKMKWNCICSDSDERLAYIAAAVEATKARFPGNSLFERKTENIAEEIAWISRQGLASLEEYVAADRVGRSTLRIDRKIRPTMFELFLAYKKIRSDAGKLYDWDDLALAANQQLETDTSARRYKHIVIDEGQDFSPEMLRSLVKAIPADGSLTFFGDSAQQIYGRGISWRSAGLRITKPWEFRENYRNSKQIARLALAICKMPYYTDVPDMVEPIARAADGPKPALVRCKTPESEISFVMKQATAAAKTQSVAILFRNREDEESIQQFLPPEAIRLHRDMTTWQAGPGVRYGTYHSAKGLEFDLVILPRLSTDRLPDPGEIEIFGDDDAKAGDGKLLYVAITRARARLIMTHVGEPTELLPPSDGIVEVFAE